MSLSIHRNPARVPGRVLAGVVLALGVLAGSPCRAEIPAEQAMGLYEHTNPDHRELSPLWGMVALRSGVLAQIRFFGPYGSRKVPGLPVHPQVPEKYNCPLDAVAGVVEYLFPSPDGENLVQNEWDKDPIGEIAKEARQAPHPRGGLRKVLFLLDAAASYRNQIRQAGPGESLEGASRDFREGVYRILDRARTSADGDGRGTAYNQRREAFAGLLQRAVLEETTDTSRLYPPNIVEVSLLAYAWRVADRVDQLYDAFDGWLLAKPEHEAKEPRRVFDARIYRDGLPDFLRRAEAAPSSAGEPGAAPSPGETALFLYGFARFERSIPDLVPYAITTYGKISYPDCGETALRNFFNCIFCQGGAVDFDRLRTFVEYYQSEEFLELKKEDQLDPPVHPGTLDAILAFYTRYPDVSLQNTVAAHADWSQIVSGLNTPGDPIPIFYRTKGVCNVAATGLCNLLDLIGHLLPDPMLQAPWSTELTGQTMEELAALKLEWLCHLVGSKDNQVTWKVAGGKPLAQGFPQVVFFIRGIPSFRLICAEGHYSVLPVAQERREAWPARLAGRTRQPWLDLWAQALTADTRGFAWHPLPWTSPCEVFSCDLRNPEGVQQVLETIVGMESGVLKPTFLQIVARTLPFDVLSVNRIVHSLGRNPPFKADPHVYPIPSILERPEAEKTAMLFSIANNPANFSLLAGFLLDHGAGVRSPDHAKVSLVCSAINSGEPELALRLIQAGADLEARDAYGNPPIFLASIKRRYNHLLVPLIRAGANPKGETASGLTALEAARSLEEDGEEDKAVRATVALLESAIQEWELKEKNAAQERAQEGHGAAAGRESKAPGPAAAPGR